jgi:protein-disulfide isomerase
MVMVSLFMFAGLATPMAQATTPNPAVNPTPVVVPPKAVPAPAMTEAQVKDIQKIVHDYLIQNPQVLVEASQAYQDQENAKAKTKTQQAVIKNAKALFTSPHTPTVGNLSGDVTVVEFLDYQCSHCREMSTIIGSLIKADNKVRFVVKDLPIFGGSSKYAALASIAAIKQGPDKYMAFHKGLLETPPPLTDKKVLEIAKNAGLNVAQLEADMKDKATDAQISDNFKMAQELGLLGTPAFIISNRTGTLVEYVPGAVTLDSLKQSISKVRK